MSYRKILVYLVVIETFYDLNDFGLKYCLEPANISLIPMTTSTFISVVVLHSLFFRVILTRYGV